MAEQVAEKTHALLSPSGAHRWMPCPGSVVLEAPFEDSGSFFADWGTVCHEVADLVLQEAVRLIDPTTGLTQWGPQDAEAYVGRVFTVGDKDYTFDMEMADCVNDYVAHVESYWAPSAILLPETEVPLDHITGETGATGTSDCVIIHPNEGEICVIDLKGGKGVMVDAEDNPQGLMYASGTIEEYDLLYGPFEKIRIVIIQPRLNHVSEWVLTREQFDAEIEKIRAAAKQVEEATRKIEALGRANLDNLDNVDFGGRWLQPGEKQCRFCKAARNKACPALDSFVEGQLAKGAPPAKVEDFPDLTLPKKAAASDPGLLDGDALAEAWRAVPLIKTWIEGVVSTVHTRLHDGIETGNLCLYEGKRGARFWSDKEAAEERMKRSRVKADDMYSKSLISPTQAEKTLKDNKSLWADLAGFIDQKDGQPVVGVAGDEKRKVWLPVQPEDFPDLDAEEDDLFA